MKQCWTYSQGTYSIINNMYAYAWIHSTDACYYHMCAFEGLNILHNPNHTSTWEIRPLLQAVNIQSGLLTKVSCGLLLTYVYVCTLYLIAKHMHAGPSAGVQDYRNIYIADSINNNWLSRIMGEKVCTQLTKAYVAKTYCRKLLLIGSAMHMLKINLLVIE